MQIEPLLNEDEFFAKRWNQPLCRWRKRLLPLVSCAFLCFFVVFFSCYAIGVLLKRTVLVENLFSHSMVCTGLSIAVVYINYYFHFRRMASFTPVKVTLERLQHHD